jgi:hypothetical protein
VGLSHSHPSRVVSAIETVIGVLCHGFLLDASADDLDGHVPALELSELVEGSSQVPRWMVSSEPMPAVL